MRSEASASRSPRSRGFALLEALVAIAVAAILTLDFSRQVEANGLFDGVEGVTVHAVFFADAIDHASIVPKSAIGDTEGTASARGRDGARGDAGVEPWWEALASVPLVLLLALLSRMSWQLAQRRLREGEAVLVHARCVEYLAYHDHLTGLPNWSLFSKLLSQSIRGAHRYGRQLAVALLDVDRFKQINDTLGHEAGDQLLQEVAKRLTESLRDSDMVARLEGDEFVVLLAELGDAKYTATAARKILSVIAAPFTLVGHELRVTACIGISTYPRDGLDEHTLTRNAAIAMYRAKAVGKNYFQCYSDAPHASPFGRFALESSLREALENEEFQLHYQPKQDIRSGRIIGMEVLLRWDHPDFGMLAPMQFIPIAEGTGLILALGRWVLKTACAQNVAWQKQGLPSLCIAVNLTVRQFCDEQLIPDVAAILEATGMDPHLLELEITESLLVHEVETTLRILMALKSLGVRVAIDDFGTNYSSVATLQRFPLDTIKIDRSVIRDVTGATTAPIPANAIIAMGKSLSLTVVAQGVETGAQAGFLRAHACDGLQGFYFKKPVPAEQFAQFLQAQTTGITYIGKRVICKTV